MRKYTEIKIRNLLCIALHISIIAIPIAFITLCNTGAIEFSLDHIAIYAAFTAFYYISIPLLKSVSEKELIQISKELEIDAVLLEHFSKKTNVPCNGYGMINSFIYFAKNGHKKGENRTGSVVFLAEQNKILRQ